MNTKLRKKNKKWPQERLFQDNEQLVFGKTMENVRTHRDIKLVTTEMKRNYLVSEPNYHITKFFREILLAIGVEKTQIRMSKSVYLGLSISNPNKTLMYDFWHNYVKPKYGVKTKICSMDANRFIVHEKVDDIYKDIAEDVEKRFASLNYKMNRKEKESFWCDER